MRRSDRPSQLAAYLSGRDVSCPECQYNLRGLKKEACPECGYELDEVLIRQITNRRGLLRRAVLIEWTSDQGLIANLVIGIMATAALSVVIVERDGAHVDGVAVFVLSILLWLAASTVWGLRLERADRLRGPAIASWVALMASAGVGVFMIVV